MKILVTGSQGGIGRWLVKALLEAGHTLRTLDQAAEPRGIDWEHFPGDVRDLSLVRRAVQGMEAVMHLAAILSETKGLELLYTVNIQGTWNILMACEEAGITRVINFSSVQAIGHSSPVHTDLSFPLDDQVPKQPYHAYQTSKQVGEEICTAYARQHGLEIFSLRPTYVFRSNSGADRGWLGRPDEVRAHQAANDYWSFVDVRDVCEAARLCLTAPLSNPWGRPQGGHQTLMLSSDYTHARLPTVELARKYYPHIVWPRVTPEEYTKDNPFRSLIDSSLAKQALGWQPVFSTRQAVLDE